MRSRLSVSALAILVGTFGLTLCGPPKPVTAKVEVPTYATVTADDATVKDLLLPSIARSKPSRRATWMG